MAHKQCPNQVVHVRENSKESMDSLFKVLNDNPTVRTSSYKDRNLPLSFFNQPNRPHPNHSRESSQDSTHFQAGHNGLQPAHSRSQSLPAQILGTGSTLTVPNHHKQQSFDLLDDQNRGSFNNFSHQQHSPQPNAPQQQQRHQQLTPQPQVSQAQNSGPQGPQQQGWANIGPQGPQHCVGVVASQGSSPNKGVSVANVMARAQGGGGGIVVPASGAGMMAQGGGAPGMVGMVQQQQQQGLPPLLQALLQPLPYGWEMSLTPDEEIYFINHIDRNTSWTHPASKQQHGPVRLIQLALHHQNIVRRHVQQSQAAIHQQQIQQGMTNMIVGVPQQQQQQTQQQQADEQSVLEQLAKLEREKLRLKKQQEDIDRQEQILRQRNMGAFSPGQGMMQGGGGPAPPNTVVFSSPQQSQQASTVAQAQAAAAAKMGHVGGGSYSQSGLAASTPNLFAAGGGSMMEDMGGPSTTGGAHQRSSSHDNMLSMDMMIPDRPAANQHFRGSSVDPFLGQPPNLDTHVRQSSTDSGLGGMGNFYSLPRNLADIPSSVDRMDTRNIPADEMGGMGMDMGIEGADELISSLTPDILEQNMDNMQIWL